MPLKLHPLLNDRDAVLISLTNVTLKPTAEQYESAAIKALTAMRVELNGEKVAIKPNVTSGEHFADPDTGVTTHPVFVGGMVKYLYQHGAKIGGVYVVEDPRDSDDHNPRHWIKTGYVEMAEETGARLRCPNSYFCVKKKVPDPLVFPVRNVTRYAVDPSTVLISVPKMKTHNLGVTTLNFKNLMGLDDVFERHYCGYAWGDLPRELVHNDLPKNKWMDEQLHEVFQAGLAKRLIDLAKVIPPQLCMVDGVIARDGTGFQRGTNYPLGMVVAGINMVAVDSVTSYIMGFDPLKLVYTRMAAENGLGTNDIAKLHIYIVKDGEVVPCPDVEKYRSKTKFKVIRDIIGEEA